MRNVDKIKNDEIKSFKYHTRKSKEQKSCRSRKFGGISIIQFQYLAHFTPEPSFSQPHPPPRQWELVYSEKI